MATAAAAAMAGDSWPLRIICKGCFRLWLLVCVCAPVHLSLAVADIRSDV